MASTYKDVTDAQVLTQLKRRKVKLQLELERVEIAIRAFETNITIDLLDAAVYEVEEQTDTTIIQDDLAMSILMYNPRLTAEKKIEYALSKIGSADADQISSYLVRIDGHVKNADRFYNNITYVASRMYKAGKLSAEKVGKRNVYRLVEYS
jgi:hypothetical protein